MTERSDAPLGELEAWRAHGATFGFEVGQIAGKWAVIQKDGASTNGDELSILTNVLNQARETLLVSIKAPDALQSSLGKLNLACKAHWDWQTEKMKRHEQR